MAILVDWVKQAVSGAPGTGVITLGSAVSGYIRFQDDTRISDGSTVYYTIEDGDNRERGIGTYASSGTTLTRTAIRAKRESGTYSENPGTGLNLTSAAVVSCSAIAATHNFRGCLLKHSTTESIASSTSHQLSWDTEIYDTDGFHDTVTNNSRITIPTNSGIERIRLIAGVDWAANGTSYRMARFYKNGSLANPGAASTLYVNTSTTNAFNNLSSPVLDCAGGDYFEVDVFQATGSALNVNDTTYAHFFAAEVVE